MTKYGPEYVRIDKDHYPTPPWPVTALTEHVDLEGTRVWECAYGDGRMSEALKATGADVYSTDIERRGYFKQSAVLDFLTPGRAPDPPYGNGNRLAEKFIERGLLHIANGGLLALLLPIDFDSGKTRWRLFGDCPDFVAKIVLTSRITWFRPPPGPDARNNMGNHAWCLWRCKPRAPSPVLLYARTEAPR